ncbi:ABC transporter permease [Halorarum halophilum]|uniref:ABC transporter permease n=1 Tax=Halorarum halophilum TaxID=2743090 RepID=A0A7D5KFJ6_9EURY|nr:ABC transporter permease [Halobaculum halophilum]QLG29017.1 ABC transporter permease [Halobaculum halophilum]
MSDRQVDEDIPLEVVSDVDRTREDRIRDLLLTYVVVPGRILITDPRALFGFGVVIAYLLIGTVGVWLLEPTEMWAGGRLVQPFQTLDHPLGTDPQGRDLLKMIIFGTPPILTMIFSGGLFVVVVGTVVGTVAGFSGGRLDDVLSTITDVALTIPGLPLIIVLAVTLEPENPVLIGVLLGINGWAGLARNLRSQVLSVREEDYVEAADAMGIPMRSILLKDVMPNVMPYVMYNFMSSMRGVLFAAIGLYYLGVLPYNQDHWGVLIRQAYAGGALTAGSMFHWILWPIVTVVLLSIGLILVSQSTDRLFNPRVHARHED